MSPSKPTTQDAVVGALASQRDLTVAEIAASTGLGRSTVNKTLAGLERAGRVRRRQGGREGGRRLPDRWSSADAPPAAHPSKRRLRRGQLDQLVLEFVDARGAEGPLGPGAVAKALGRSAGAVGNCLARLAAAGRVRQVGERPRRYRSTTAARRDTKEQS